MRVTRPWRHKSSRSPMLKSCGSVPKPRSVPVSFCGWSLVVVVVVGRWSLLWWFSLSLIVGRGRCRRCWSLPWSFVIVVGHWSLVVGRWLLWFSLVVVVLVVVVRCRDRWSLIVDLCRWSLIVVVVVVVGRCCCRWSLVVVVGPVVVGRCRYRWSLSLSFLSSLFYWRSNRGGLGVRGPNGALN